MDGLGFDEHFRGRWVTWRDGPIRRNIDRWTCGRLVKCEIHLWNGPCRVEFVIEATGRRPYKQIGRNACFRWFDEDLVLSPLHFELRTPHRNRANRLGHFEN